MWCPHCQADVTAEVSRDSRRMYCATCGDELKPPTSATPPSDASPARDAQDLLARWSQDELLGESETPPQPPAQPTGETPPLAPPIDSPADAAPPQGTAAQPPAIPPSAQVPPAAPIPPVAPASPTGQAPPSPVEPPAQPHAFGSGPKFRFDAPHRGPAAESGGASAGSSRPRKPFFTQAGSDDRVAHGQGSESGGPSDSQQRRERPTRGAAGQPPQAPPPPVAQDNADNFPPGYTVHAAHASVPAPHFDIQALIARKEKKKTNWTSVLGQMLAYGGVALLTVGTALVLGGYFGGPDDYMRTGWLTATVGQMLLFLGVVTLVSSGMEQTSDEVSERVETLGRHILRIEHYSRIHSMTAGGPNGGPPSAPPPESDSRAA